MFSSENLKYLDSSYFSIITTDAYDVTIMFRNTGITGICIIRSIRITGQWSYSISIKLRIHTASTAG